MRLIDADRLKEVFRRNTGYAFDELIDAAPTAEAIPVEWIPVSERLPKDNKTKIVQIKGINVVEAGYYSNGDWWCISSAGTLSILEVVAWMELPEPYRGEE